nr:hypothetical protein [Chromobacterium sp. ASV5]
MLKNNALLTISSINYLGQVRTLFRSAQMHEGDAARYVVLVDRCQFIPDWDESLATIIWVEDLLDSETSRASFIFNILELNTNVKPAALNYLSERHERVVYLDPDTELFASLKPVWEALKDSAITLTPHMLHPSLDDRMPSQIDLMRHGSFNLGFIGVRSCEITRSFLQWWSTSCLRYGFCSPQDGLYVDQKLIDLVPAYFPGVCVLRHPGLNVAYWNLHERVVSGEGQLWQVDDQPLIFMHFSGFIFKPSDAQKDRVSKYPSRVDLKTHPELRVLFDGYRERLASNGFEKYASIPYSFNSFSDGTPINNLARRVVAVNIIAEAKVGDYFDANGPVFAYCKSERLLAKVAKTGSETIGHGRNGFKRELGKKIFRLFFRIFGIDRYLQLVCFCQEMGSTLKQGFIGSPFDHKNQRNR